MPLPRRRKLCPALVRGGNLQDQWPVQGGNADFTTGNGGEDIDLHLHMQVIPFTLKGFIGQDMHDQKQISGRPPLAGRGM
jgi:hypothetical protein